MRMTYVMKKYQKKGSIKMNKGIQLKLRRGVKIFLQYHCGILDPLFLYMIVEQIFEFLPKT